MSAQPVNALTQFVETKTGEFKANGSGYRELRQFLLSTDDAGIHKCAQEVFKRGQSKEFEKISKRVKVFIEAFKTERGSSAEYVQITEAAEKVLTVLKNHKNFLDPLGLGAFVESNMKRGIFNGNHHTIATSDKALVAAIIPEFDKLLRTTIPDAASGKPIPLTDELKFERLDKIFSKNEPKIIKLAIGKFIESSSKGVASKLKILILKKYASYLGENYYKFKRDTFETIQNTLTEIRQIYLVFDVYTEAQMDKKLGFFDLSEVEEDPFVIVMEDKPARQSSVAWFKSIISEGPDAVARHRKTGGIRNAFGYSPYEKGPQYHAVRALLNECDATELKTLFCETVMSGAKPQREVLQRFYEAFMATEGRKQTSDTDVENIRGKVKLALEFVELKRAVEKYVISDFRKDTLDRSLTLYMSALELLASRDLLEYDHAYDEQLSTFRGQYFLIVNKTGDSLHLHSRLIDVFLKLKIPREMYINLLNDPNKEKFVESLKRAVKSGMLDAADVNHRILVRVLIKKLIAERT